jgi:hypothetical protein
MNRDDEPSAARSELNQHQASEVGAEELERP